jgi:signal transduction histidine kinase
MSTLHQVYKGVVLETLEELSAIVAPEDILRKMADKLGHALQADRCAFMVMGPGPQNLKIVNTYEDRRFRDFTLDVAKYPELVDALSSPCDYKVYQSSTTPFLRSIVDVGNLAPEMSILVLPIVVDEDSDRTFFLRASRQGRDFDPAEIDFCAELARISRNLLRRTFDYRRMESRFREAMKTRQHALKINQRKNRLLQFISHELKNPICILNGYINYLAMPDVGPLNSTQQEVVNESRQLCEYVLNALHSLINYSTFSDGRMTYHYRSDCLSGVVYQVLTRVRLEADRKSIQIRHNIPEELPKISMDAGKIYFAVANVVYNALRHTPEGGWVDIALGVKTLPFNGKPHPFVVLSVADTGPGVPAEKIDHLFKPVQAIGCPSDSGHDLGLIIARRILSKHGGKIKLDRKYTRGARFLLALPAERQDDGERCLPS